MSEWDACRVGSQWANYDLRKRWYQEKPFPHVRILTSYTWDKQMARKTYRIELKLDVSDDNRHDAMLEVCKQYARDVLASAMLLQDGRPPSVALITDDTFTGSEEISLLQPGEVVHTPNV